MLQRGYASGSRAKTTRTHARCHQRHHVFLDCKLVLEHVDGAFIDKILNRYRHETLILEFTLHLLLAETDEVSVLRQHGVLVVSHRLTIHKLSSVVVL